MPTGKLICCWVAKRERRIIGVTADTLQWKWDTLPSILFILEKKLPDMSVVSMTIGIGVSQIIPGFKQDVIISDGETSFGPNNIGKV